MKPWHYVLIPGFAILSGGCSSGQSGGSARSVTESRVPSPVSITAPDSITPLPTDSRPLTWVENAVHDFLARGKSPLIADARRRGQDLSWIIDRTEAREDAVFTIVHIGHDESEPDGSSRRFATAGWLYLDTTHRIVYEYDLPNDSLIEWN